MCLDVISWPLTIVKDPFLLIIFINCNQLFNIIIIQTVTWFFNMFARRKECNKSDIFHWAEFPSNFTLAANFLLMRLISKSHKFDCTFPFPCTIVFAHEGFPQFNSMKLFPNLILVTKFKLVSENEYIICLMTNKIPNYTLFFAL